MRSSCHSLAQQLRKYEGLVTMMFKNCSAEGRSFTQEPYLDLCDFKVRHDLVAKGKNTENTALRNERIL